MHAFVRQHYFDFVHLSGRQQRAQAPGVAGLASRFPFAFVLTTARSLETGQTVGKRRLGGVRGVALASGQLAFQVCDLPLSIRDLLPAWVVVCRELAPHSYTIR